MFTYSLIVDVDGIVSNLEASFPSEEAANEWADIMADYIVEFSCIEIPTMFEPPF